MKRLVFMIAAMLLACTGTKAQKAAKQVADNTLKAVASEALYMTWTDSMVSDKEMTLVHATARYMLKKKDMETREWNLDFQNRIIYRMLVQQFNGLISDVNQLTRLVTQHPEHSAGCFKACSDMLLQAYALGKHAVVVAMNSKVPLPWKVKYGDFLEGKDETPPYERDPSRDPKDNDGTNLLLPTERYKILNDTYGRIIEMRLALNAVIAKFSVDMTWQKAVLYAVKFDDELHEVQKSVFQEFSSSIADRPLP